MTVRVGERSYNLTYCVYVDSKAPELKKRLKDLVRQRDETTDSTITTHSKDRMTGEFAMDIGLSC